MKTFMEPAMEVMVFDANDVIATSGGSGGNDGCDNQSQWDMCTLGDTPANSSKAAE